MNDQNNKHDKPIVCCALGPYAKLCESDVDHDSKHKVTLESGAVMTWDYVEPATIEIDARKSPQLFDTVFNNEPGSPAESPPHVDVAEKLVQYRCTATEEQMNQWAETMRLDVGEIRQVLALAGLIQA